MSTYILRDATLADVPDLLRLIRALAAYGRMSERCVTQEADIARALFGPRPYGQAIIVEQDGRALGMALWHTTFSTFTGRLGYWLEDLFIEPEQRGAGIGRALFVELARRLAAEGGSGMMWHVHKWNAPSIEFYLGLGAQTDPSEWGVMSLSDDALARLLA